MTIIAFILIFGIVVIAHEFGHFLLAKLNGIRVVEFAVGMGPTILKFTKGETRYALKLLPIGGACMFEGEDGKVEAEPEDAIREQDVPTNTLPKRKSGSFQDANVWARISSVIAGPIFNLVLAFLLALIIVGFSGTDLPVITSTMEGYPASEAGLQAGDVITKINGNKVHIYREVTLESYLNKGEPMEIEYKRGDTVYSTIVVPKYSEEDARYYIGFTGGPVEDCKGFSLVKYGYYEVRFSLKSTFKSLAMLVQGKVSKDEVAGPVGIAVAIDDTIEAATPYGISTVVLSMINIAILLSVNLGVLNLLPLPALDGGRLIFLLIEVVRGKPIDPEKEGIVHFIGFVALMVLMVFVLFNDISRLFQ